MPETWLKASYPQQYPSPPTRVTPQVCQPPALIWIQVFPVGMFVTWPSSFELPSLIPQHLPSPLPLSTPQVCLPPAVNILHVFPAGMPETWP